MILSPYRAVQGFLPRRYEILKWSEAQFLGFFRIANALTVDGKFKITKEALKQVEDTFMPLPPCPEQEVLWRINQFTTDNNSSVSVFRLKLETFNRLIGYALKDNPILITKAIAETVKDNPRLAWIATNYLEITTKTGAKAIVKSTFDATSPQSRQIKSNKPENPEVRLITGVEKLANAFEIMANSLSERELKRLGTMEKFNALLKLVTIFEHSKNLNQRSQPFTQINIYRSEANDLEKAMLDYAEKK